MTCKSNPVRPPPSLVCFPGLGRNVFHKIAVAGEDAENASVETRSIFQYLQELWLGRDHINACDKMGSSPLMIAVVHSKVDLINMMIATGADGNLGSLPPLYLASWKQNWANEQIGKVGGRWITRRIKKIADTMVMILQREGARVDIDPHTGIPRALDVFGVFKKLRDQVYHHSQKVAIQLAI